MPGGGNSIRENKFWEKFCPGKILSPSLKMGKNSVPSGFGMVKIEIQREARKKFWHKFLVENLMKSNFP